ncbi:DUF4476 domain-containing protein [Ferruginibacter sp. SUN106]|uniref:DUF4476 domain-containing protein n=1 Tax=Ferruginibacter sp. SUN106 TaxID=2978348 RepID=UPI003D36CDCF
MNKVYKKAFSFLSAMIIFSLSLSAQQNHFIYVQTENKQPFYIKLEKKILSSSASGYLIIPKLQDGNYSITIGFPKNEWPEQNVTCSINKKDVGYLLKNFGDKGWGLFNLQTMDVVMSGTKPQDKMAAANDTKTDIFSNTLSSVVNDPSILKKTEEKPAIKEEVKPPVEVVTKKEEESNKNVAAVKEIPVITKPEDKPVAKEEVKPIEETIKKEEIAKQQAPGKIARLFSIRTAEGTDMVYTDIVNGQADTIRIFIPEEKKEAVVVTQPEKKIEPPVIEIPKKEELKPEVIKQKEVKKEETPKPANQEEVKKEESPKVEIPKEAEKKEEVKSNEPKFIDIELPNPNSKKDTAVKQVTPVIVPEEKKVTEVQVVPEKPKEPVKPVIANSDCKNFASEEDFLKLRKKMAAEESDDKMVDVAKKLFRSKCFTTEQIKNLSVLFLKDEGKYKFFDAAYPFVSDSYNFGTLEAQLTDNYFITRFKAMIRH